MGHSVSIFSALKSSLEAGGWSEVARTTGITTSAQTRVKRRGMTNPGAVGRGQE